MKLQIGFHGSLIFCTLSLSAAFMPWQPFQSRVSIVATWAEDEPSSSPSPSPSTLRTQRQQLESILRDKVAKQSNAPGEAAVLRAQLAEIDYAIAMNARMATAKAIQRIQNNDPIADVKEEKDLDSTSVEAKTYNSYIEEVAARRAESSSKSESQSAEQYIKEVVASSPASSTSALRVQLRQLESILKEKVMQQTKIPVEQAALNAKLADIDYALGVITREEANEPAEPASVVSSEASAETAATSSVNEAKRINEVYSKIKRPIVEYVFDEEQPVGEKVAPVTRKEEPAKKKEEPAKVDIRRAPTRVQLRQLESILKQKMIQLDQTTSEAAALRSKLADIDYALALVAREETKQALEQVRPASLSSSKSSVTRSTKEESDDIKRVREALLSKKPVSKEPKVPPAQEVAASPAAAPTTIEAAAAETSSADDETPVKWLPANSYLEEIAASRAASTSKMELPEAEVTQIQQEPTEPTVGDYLLEVSASRTSSSSKMELEEDESSTDDYEYSVEAFLLEVAARRATSSSKMELADEEMSPAEEEVTVDSFLLEVAARRAASSSKMELEDSATAPAPVEEVATVDSFLLEVASRRAGSTSKMAST